MIQIDIDRYNKGQNEYTIKLLPSVVKPHFEILQDGERVELLVLEELLLSESWREMFDKDPDYQKEFRKLMKTKTIKHKRINIIKFDYINNKWAMVTKIYHNAEYYGDWSWFVIPMTPQMLTGYILEFMQENQKGGK